MRNKFKCLYLVLLAFITFAFASCDHKTPDKGYLTDEEVIEIIKGFSTEADYTKYSFDGNVQYLNIIEDENSKKNADFIDSLDKYDNKNTVSYYLRMPMHITYDNWTYYDQDTKGAFSTKEKIESMLLTYGKTLDKVYYYTNAEGDLIIKTFGANKALMIKNPCEIICHAKWNVTITYNSKGYLVSEVYETINAQKEAKSETCYGQGTYKYFK